MYEKALGRIGEVVAGIPAEQLSDPTPCPDWDVRALLNHIVGGCLSFAGGATGEKFDGFDGQDRLGDDHVAAYEKAAEAAAGAFRAPGALDGTFAMQWGDTPAMAALGLAIAEAAVHGWDLASATGQEAGIPDDVAATVLHMTRSQMQPEGEFPRGESFGDPIDVPDDAPVQDRMLAYMGRRP
jgi:uncharacterized protein (TIGR03086 family)